MDTANNKEFNERIEKVGKLYEEGKECLFTIEPVYEPTQSEKHAYSRLFEILKQLRDIACTQIQDTHKLHEN